MVSRPLESPRMLALEPYIESDMRGIESRVALPLPRHVRVLCVQRPTNLRSVTWTKVSFLTQLAFVSNQFVPWCAAYEAGEDAGNCAFNCQREGSTIANLGRGHLPPKTSSPSRTWGPREMFSCAGRAVFLGAILTVIRWSWDFAVVVPSNSSGQRSLARILMGAVRNALLTLAVRGRRKRGTSENSWLKP